MTARRTEDLQCWRLANELRKEVHAICENPAAGRDFKFCDSFRDAVGSVCRNISEGFARYSSAEIVRFFRYALASLEEVKDHLEECRIRNLLEAEGWERLHDLAEHTKATLISFMKPHQARCRARGDKSGRSRGRSSRSEA
jgi:four helix bundle protein